MRLPVRPHSWNGRTRVMALFLVVAVPFGLALGVATPPFASPDEATHFFRSYQLSQGEVFADATDDAAGGYLPSSVERDVHAVDRPGPDPSWSHIWRVLRRPTGGEKEFFDFRNTALYPPLTYAPQTVAITLGRGLGVSNLGLMYLARLANLAVFLALIALAIRWFPRSGWFPAAVALLPSTMFLAASVSADALTIGLGAVVVAAALSPERRWWAVGACVALGLAKPPYFLLGLVLLAVWWREERRDWRLVTAPAISLVLAVTWSRWADHIFRPYRPIIDPNLEVEPDRQLSHLLHNPFRFLGAALRTTTDDGFKWLGQAVAPFGRSIEVAGPLAIAAWVFLAVVGVAVMRADEPPAWMRSLVAALAVVTVSATLVAVYLYSNEVDAHRIGLVYGRYLLPALPALAMALPQPAALRRIVATHEATLDVGLAGAAALMLLATVVVVAR